MSRVILQPSASKIAYKHFEDTIKTPVPMGRISAHVDPALLSDIQNLYPNGLVYMWGVTNGKNGQNEKAWRTISKGDVTLFSGKGRIFASAVITLAFKNSALAHELWGEDNTGNTWENIYLVEEIQNMDIPYSKFNQILGYQPKNVIQGFEVLNEEKSNKLINAFELSSDSYPEEVSETDYSNAINNLEGEESLDTSVISNGRKEQSFLRNNLFKSRRTSKCGICGREFPVDMLIASHIKKRCDCTKEEKLDYKHVVMPMCKCGCDDLYEKGYVFVEAGTIKVNRDKLLTPDLETYLQDFEGKPCPFYDDDSAKYFAAHQEKFGQ